MKLNSIQLRQYLLCMRSLLLGSLLMGGVFGSPLLGDDASTAGDSEQAAETVLLRGGGSLQGHVVKRTPKLVFVDVGYTILAVPTEEVVSIERPKVDDPNADAPASTPQASEEKVDIFFTRRLEPGTIEQKAREVSQGVVQILCLGKSGSGFVIDNKAGYVVTNFHVIENEQNISIVVFVRDAGGFRRVKKEAVRIVAFTPLFDLALLQIEDLNDTPLTNCYLGDYHRVNVGDPVFAVGSPLGLERTVTEGIVSNRSRALGGVLAIQTTAPINPGNSGGPLFNQRGEVVGVNSRKILGGENLGFAIPIHFVKDFLRHRDSYAYDKDNPNTGIRYLAPPAKSDSGSEPTAQNLDSSAKRAAESLAPAPPGETDREL